MSRGKRDITPEQRAKDREYAAATRKRKQEGRGVLRLEVDLIATAQRLIDDGHLTREEQDDRAKIEALLETYYDFAHKEGV